MTVHPDPATTPGRPSTPESKVRVKLRDLFIVVVAVVAGILAEELLRRSGVPFGQAVVAGAAAAGGVFYFMDRLVE